jgi:dynactin 1
MDHLQTDIDSLETEKGQLKEKLKSIGKKTISVSGTDSLAGNTSITSTLDNKYYVQEINALKEALNNEHQQRKKILCDTLRQKLESLEPLSLPAHIKSSDSTIQELRRKTNNLVKVIVIYLIDI